MAKKPVLSAHYCPICGKEFYPTPMWVYKDLDNIYCSYHCLRKAETAPVKKTYNTKPVQKLSLEEELIEEFDCPTDAAVSVDGSEWGIRKACRDKTKYKKYLWRYKE